MRPFFLGLALLCALAAARARADLDATMAALDASDVERAAALIAGLSRAEQESPRGLFQRGMLAFLRGQYREADALLERAIADSPRSPHLSDFRKLREWARAADTLTADYAEVSAERGRYVVRYPKGQDAVLASYALDAMQRADRAIETFLDIHLPAPIRLEIYPSARALAQVSSLTLEHIETTGTVALCKWNRLMIASPRSLVYGYPWLDTINHELVHLALTYASKNRAPVWFHEGLAKLYERTWRGEAPLARLTPATETLLHSAARQKRLIGFERMHPSIAMLPSQEDAALAFAQVATFLERFREAHTDRGLSQAIEAMALGMDAQKALARIAGKSFDALEQAWQKSLLEREPASKTKNELKLRFVEGGKADESLDVPEAHARRHLRVGDMLWGRNHPVAAAREYESGQRYAPSDPILASRVARAWIGQSKSERALLAVDAALREHPHHAPLWALKGHALLALGRGEASVQALRESIRQNPFDPGPHCDLVRAEREPAAVEVERDNCAVLTGRAAPP